MKKILKSKWLWGTLAVLTVIGLAAPPKEDEKVDAEPTTTMAATTTEPATTAPPTTVEAPADEVDAVLLTRLSLTLSWDDMALADQLMLCEGVRSLGAEYAAEQVMESAENSEQYDRGAVESWLRDRC